MSSPVSSLSAELLTLILDLLISETIASANDPIACGPEDDTIIVTSKIIRCASQVCSTWRSICLGNPLWWSTISIVHPWSLDDVKMRLERAQQCSLDLRIFGNVEYTTRTKKPAEHRDSDGLTSPTTPLSSPTLAMYGTLFEVIFPVLERCRVLHIRGVFTDSKSVIPFQYLEHIADTSFPVLEHLIFEGDLTKYNDELSLPAHRPFFSSTPNLKHLRLIGVDIRKCLFSSPSFSSSLSSVTSSPSLTTLHLSSASSPDLQISFADLKFILDVGCPALTALFIYDDVIERFAGRAATVAPATFTTTAPSLKSLYILGNMLSVSQLLLFLHAPNMTELIIAPISAMDLQYLWQHDYPNYSNRPPDSTQEEYARALAMQLKSATNRYPSLTQLTLAPARPEDMSSGLLYTASRCFPLIERLIMVLPAGYREAFKAQFFASKEDFPNLFDLVFHLELGIDADLLSKSCRPPNDNDLETRSKPLKPKQLKRIASWARSVPVMYSARETHFGVPLRNICFDRVTIRAFELYAQERSHKWDNDIDGYLESSEFEMPVVKESNIWEEQRRKMLFTHVKDLFLGRVATEH